MALPILSVKTKEFNQLLHGLSKLNDSAILEVSDKTMYSIISSDDRSLFLWASLEGNFKINSSLNLPSVSKLISTLDILSKPEIQLSLASNHLSYKDSAINFKYHLYENGILPKAKLSLAKIKSLTYDFSFEVTKAFISTILKTSSIFKTTNKLYIYTEGSHLIWSLADRSQTNTDSLTIVGDRVNFDMDEFIISLDNIRLLSFGDNTSVKFHINRNGIGKMELISEGLKLNYIATSLTI